MLAYKTDYDTLSTNGLPKGTREWYLAKRLRKLGYVKGGGRLARFREIAKYKPVSIVDILNDRMPRICETMFWFYVWHVDPLCVYCGVKLTKRNRTQDHVIPRSKGGGQLGRTNLAPCCQDCNWDKADQSLLRFLANRANNGRTTVPSTSNAKWSNIVA